MAEDACLSAHKENHSYLSLGTQLLIGPSSYALAAASTSFLDIYITLFEDTGKPPSIFIPMTLLTVLEANKVQLRSDIRDAVSASPDMYNATQESLMKPQLLYGAKWAEENVSNEGGDKVLLMGWASLGHRTLGGPILGMFILTEKKLCFVRDDSKANVSEDKSIQEYDIEKITGAKQSGLLALRKVSFVVEGKDEITWERIHKVNAKTIIAHLIKKQ